MCKQVREGYIQIAKEKKDICIFLDYNSDEIITHKKVVEAIEKRLFS
ncbi:MAG: hypothetical protein AABW81_02895 [Nanoarchaeota archaeon]